MDVLNLEKPHISKLLNLIENFSMKAVQIHPDLTTTKEMLVLCPLHQTTKIATFTRKYTHRPKI